MGTPAYIAMFLAWSYMWPFWMPSTANAFKAAKLLARPTVTIISDSF
jgi:hypothetical protein